jgi:hypothetical protein
MMSESSLKEDWLADLAERTTRLRSAVRACVQAQGMCELAAMGTQDPMERLPRLNELGTARGDLAWFQDEDVEHFRGGPAPLRRLLALLYPAARGHPAAKGIEYVQLFWRASDILIKGRSS